MRILIATVRPSVPPDHELRGGGGPVVVDGDVMVGELVRHVLGEPAAEELGEFGEAGVPFPVGGGGGVTSRMRTVSSVASVRQLAYSHW